MAISEISNSLGGKIIFFINRLKNILEYKMKFLAYITIFTLISILYKEGLITEWYNQIEKRVSIINIQISTCLPKFIKTKNFASLRKCVGQIEKNYVTNQLSIQYSNNIEQKINKLLFLIEKGNLHLNSQMKTKLIKELQQIKHFFKKNTKMTNTAIKNKEKELIKLEKLIQSFQQTII